MKKNLLTLFVTLLLSLGHAFAESQEPIYNASKFGIRSDGVTMNTRSIQFAIDWIAEQGGGTLRFWVGRYLTGSIHMKSNVTIELVEGAVLVGSTNPFDYDRLVATSDHALILAEGVENIRLIGVYNSGGVIEGQGRELGNNCTDLVHKGLMKDKLSNDRVGEGFRPRLLIFRECKNVEVDNVTFRNAANWVTMYDQCENVKVNNVRIQSTAFWNAAFVGEAADEDGGREGHGEIPAVEGHLREGALRNAHPEDLRERLHHRVGDVVRESPQGEAGSDEDEGEQVIHPFVLEETLFLFHTHADARSGRA